MVERISSGYIPPMKFDPSIRRGCWLFGCKRHNHPEYEDHKKNNNNSKKFQTGVFIYGSILDFFYVSDIRVDGKRKHQAKNSQLQRTYQRCSENVFIGNTNKFHYSFYKDQVQQYRARLDFWRCRFGCNHLFNHTGICSAEK